MSRHLECARAAAFEFQGDFDAVIALDLVRHRNKRAEELGEVDRRGLLALQFGVEPAGVGNIRDQPIEPAHVVLDDVEKPAPAFLGLGDRQRLHRRAQRGERIFQFMGDIGGEAFDRFDPRIERAGHVAQRAGKVADLIAPAGEIGNLHARADAPADALGGVGQPPHRLRDRAGKQDRKHDHHAGGDQKYLDDGEPLGLHHVVDIGALRRQHQRAAHRAEALHRHRHRNDNVAALVDPHHAGVLAVQGLRHFGIALAVVRGRVRDRPADRRARATSARQ